MHGRHRHRRPACLRNPLRAERRALDGRLATALFSTRYPSQHDAVALVLITEETLDDYPVRIPMDRGMIAKVIRSIASAHPAAIGIDFVFARPTTPSADAELLSAIRDADVPIVLGAADERMGLTDKQLQYHRQFLAAADRPTGHSSSSARRISSASATMSSGRWQNRSGAAATSGALPKCWRS